MPRARLTNGSSIDIEGHVYVLLRGKEVVLGYVQNQKPAVLQALQDLEGKKGVVTAIEAGGPPGLVVEDNEVIENTGITSKCVFPRRATIFAVSQIPLKSLMTNASAK